MATQQLMKRKLKERTSTKKRKKKCDPGEIGDTVLGPTSARLLTNRNVSSFVRSRTVLRQAGLTQVYLRVMEPQKSANSRISLGGLVWLGKIPRCSGVKQKVNVVSKGSRAFIWRSNHFSASGRKLSAQLRPVRK